MMVSQSANLFQCTPKILHLPYAIFMYSIPFYPFQMPADPSRLPCDECSCPIRHHPQECMLRWPSAMSLTAADLGSCCGRETKMGGPCEQ